MIKKSVFEDEIINGMQKELAYSHDTVEGIDNLDKAIEYLKSAIDVFEDSGMTIQSDAILKILSKIAIKHRKKDHYTNGLTPEKMIANLMHHGTEFNMASDGGLNDLLNADIEERNSSGDDYLNTDDLPEMDFEDEL